MLIYSDLLKNIFFNGSTSLVGLGLLTVDVSRSLSDSPHSVGHLWTSDRPVTVSSRLTTRNPQKR